MKDEMRVFYLYNSGLLLSYGEEALLIDGVFSDANAFDKMTEGYKDALLRKQKPFENIKTLLFTHCHDDHYDETIVTMLSKKYEYVEIVAPIKRGEKRLIGETGKIVKGSFEIEYLKKRHIDVGSLTCENYVYKITAGGKSVLVTGDAEPSSIANIIKRLGCDADAFFINAATYLHEMKKPESTMLKEIKNLYIYHLPSEANDEYGYRKATVKNMAKAEVDFANIKFLLENMKLL